MNEELITPALLEARILENLDLLEQATDAYAQTALEASQAEANWKINRAVAYRSAEGTVPERDAIADQMTANELRRKLDTEATVKAAREALDSRRTVLSALQSLLRATADMVKPL